MADIEQGLKEIAEIRALMERSSKFLSLSGLAGVVAGVIGLAGAWSAAILLEGEDPLVPLLVLGAGVLTVALAASFFLTVRHARRGGQPLWTPASRLLLLALFVPLLAGGGFCISLLVHGVYVLLPATMLLFYGLGLFSASQFTHPEIRYLGYTQLVLGFLAGLFPGFGLLCWGVGFGLMHIVYGLLMYFTRDRHAAPGRS